jgi:AcrR family transcriptional regulator
MRVTAETKAATRRNILDAARRLFAERGFDSTTTRDVAAAAGIAAGTLFNYFPSKEAIVGSLAAEAMEEALADVKTDEAESLEEALFAVIAAGLRRMKPLRKHLPAFLETALNPLTTSADEASTAFRTSHLEAVAALASTHGFGHLPSTALQLYWTLYTGALAFWAADESPKQEETLALVDDSLDMFAGWLRAAGHKR